MSDKGTKTIELPVELVRRLEIMADVTGRSLNDLIISCLVDHLHRGLEQGVYSAINGLKGKVLSKIELSLLLIELCQRVSSLLKKEISHEDMMIYFRKTYRISELRDGRVLIE